MSKLPQENVIKASEEGARSKKLDRTGTMMILQIGRLREISRVRKGVCMHASRVLMYELAQRSAETNFSHFSFNFKNSEKKGSRVISFILGLVSLISLIFHSI
jgi:hypothetical protein